MAKKIISMTTREIRKIYGKDEAKAMIMARAAPEEIRDINPGGKSIARGFAAFKEHINRQGRPKAKDPKISISIRIPLSKAAGLRATGPGWQTRISNFIVSGYDRGEFTHQH